MPTSTNLTNFLEIITLERIERENVPDQNVPENVDLLPGGLGHEELLHQPGQLRRGILQFNNDVNRWRQFPFCLGIFFCRGRVVGQDILNPVFGINLEPYLGFLMDRTTRFEIPTLDTYKNKK